MNEVRIVSPRSKNAPARSNAGGTAAAWRPRRPEAATRSDAEPTTPRRPAHRPPAAGVARGPGVCVRLTSDELAALTAAAAGAPLSVWCRAVLLVAAR